MHAKCRLMNRHWWCVFFEKFCNITAYNECSLSWLSLCLYIGSERVWKENAMRQKNNQINDKSRAATIIIEPTHSGPFLKWLAVLFTEFCKFFLPSDSVLPEIMYNHKNDWIFCFALWRFDQKKLCMDFVDSCLESNSRRTRRTWFYCGHHLIL